MTLKRFSCRIIRIAKTKMPQISERGRFIAHALQKVLPLLTAFSCRNTRKFQILIVCDILISIYTNALIIRANRRRLFCGRQINRKSARGIDFLKISLLLLSHKGIGIKVLICLICPHMKFETQNGRPTVSPGNERNILFLVLSQQETCQAGFSKLIDLFPFNKFSPLPPSSCYYLLSPSEPGLTKGKTNT